MTNYQSIEVFFNHSVATVWLNRPAQRNALNRAMVVELTDVFRSMAHDDGVRLVILRGRGSVFSAGADLQWLREGVAGDIERNCADSSLLADCFLTLYEFRKPLIVFVHHAVMGGANGFCAVADIAIALRHTFFSFGEVSLGLVPAVVSPYILRKCGLSKTSEWFLTGEKFEVEEARQFGLVNRVVDETAIEEVLMEEAVRVLQNGPDALVRTKELLRTISLVADPKLLTGYTSKVISEVRMSEEGQEGMLAFFEKRKPTWV